jgi:type I restriction enzyme, S subunit
MISIETPQITLFSEEGWQKWKLAHAFNLIGSGTTPPTGSVEYFQGKIPWVNTGDLNDGYIYSVKKFVSEKAISEFSALKIFPQNSLIIAMYGATIGKLGILQMDACTNQACCIFAKPNHLDIKFVFYSLISDRNNIIELAQGGGQPNISQEIVKNLRVFAPNIATQKSIASFLDRKTAAIDTLIAKKQRLIQLLEEKRTALIDRAVTKGLNPNAPMKESGISWIGKIPEHWEVCELRRRWDVIDCKHKTPEYIDSGYPLVSTTEVKPGKIDLSIITRYISEEDFFDMTESRLPQRGDLIYSRNASLGSAAYIDTDELFAMGQDVVLITSQNQDQLYLSYYLNSKLGTLQVDLACVGSTFRRINVGQIRQILITVTPIQEQVEIGRYLERITEFFEKNISLVGRQIEKLQEYRRSLITAAVTGKLAISGVEANV